MSDKPTPVAPVITILMVLATVVTGLSFTPDLFARLNNALENGSFAQISKALNNNQ